MTDVAIPKSLKIVREVPIARSPRLIQVEGLFDMPASKVSHREWDVTLPLDEKPWNIGLILGPSGSGKSTILQEFFGKKLADYTDWPVDKSIVDGFPKTMSIKDITGLFNSVGFSSPPSWLRPFHVLSNGEKFRVTLARILAENPDLAVVDEFTSVVDRTVAQVGSAAIAKTVRRRNQRFVAAACHYDIVDWLQPDWIFEPDTCRFTWRSLQRRPPVVLEIARVDTSAWDLFRPHHYLDATLHRAARCYVAFVDGRPVAFTSLLSFPHPIAPGWRLHRTVVLPDFQGIGIAPALTDYVASMAKGMGFRLRRRMSSPALKAYCRKSPNWTQTADSGLSAKMNNASARVKSWKVMTLERLAETWEYVGPSLDRGTAAALWSNAV